MSQQPRIIHKPYLWSCGNLIGRHVNALYALHLTICHLLGALHPVDLITHVGHLSCSCCCKCVLQKSVPAISQDPSPHCQQYTRVSDACSCFWAGPVPGPARTAHILSNACSFAKYDPDLVISVHPLMQHIPIRVLKRRIRKGQMDPINFATVVTDFTTCSNLWFHRGASKCFVPTEFAARRARHASPLQPSCGVALVLDSQCVPSSIITAILHIVVQHAHVFWIRKVSYLWR